MFIELEEQMCNWTPDSGSSPDRMDAMVWAMHELLENQGSILALALMSKFCSACRMPNPKSASICSTCREPLTD
jgi:hypothetical protein